MFDIWDKQLEIGDGNNNNPKVIMHPINVPYIKNDYEIKLEKYKALLLKLQQEQNTQFAVNGENLSEEDKELCRQVHKILYGGMISFKGNFNV